MHCVLPRPKDVNKSGMEEAGRSRRPQAGRQDRSTLMDQDAGRAGSPGGVSLLSRTNVG